MTGQLKKRYFCPIITWLYGNVYDDCCVIGPSSYLYYEIFFGGIKKVQKFETCLKNSCLLFITSLQQKLAGGLFAGLFGGAQTMQVGEDTKINVPSAAPEEEAPKPRPAPAAAAPAAPAQAPAAPGAPRAPAPPPFDAAEAKRKAVLEEAKAALEREQAVRGRVFKGDTWG